MKFRQKRKNSLLKADGKELVFKNGVLEVKTVTKDLKALVSAKYIEEIKEHAKTNNS